MDTQTRQIRRILASYLPADPIAEIEAYLLAAYHISNAHLCARIINDSIKQYDYLTNTSIIVTDIYRYEYYPCDLCGELFCEKRNNATYKITQQSHTSNCPYWKDFTKDRKNKIAGSVFITIKFFPKYIPPMPIQSIIFNRRYYTLAKAKEYLRKHGHKVSKPEYTPHEIRFRQLPPKFKRYFSRKKGAVIFIIGS